MLLDGDRDVHPEKMSESMMGMYDLLLLGNQFPWLARKLSSFDL